MVRIFKNINTGLVWEIADEERALDLVKSSEYEEIVQAEIEIKPEPSAIPSKPSKKA